MIPEVEIERIEGFIREVVDSSGCGGVVVGVSGGVDSAVVSALCARALGPQKVWAYILPSAVSSTEDIEDAERHCRSFGIPFSTSSIEPVLQAFIATMEGFARERRLLGNLMARTRMAMLYYHANRLNRLVCGTSNRSEYLLGYCTKFGDNAADLQPILHLYKTEVYAIARALGIAEGIVWKPPSAGLWAGQRDEEELGLTYAEIDRALAALEANGWKATNESEERVLGLVKASRHKRAPPPSLLRGGGAPP